MNEWVQKSTRTALVAAPLGVKQSLKNKVKRTRCTRLSAVYWKQFIENKAKWLFTQHWWETSICCTGVRGLYKVTMSPELYPEGCPSGLQWMARQGDEQDQPGFCLSACAPAWNALREISKPKVMYGRDDTFQSFCFFFRSNWLLKVFVFYGLFWTEANMSQRMC